MYVITYWLYVSYAPGEDRNMSATETQVTTTREAAEAWVRGFEEGWRAPDGAEGLAAHFAPMVAPDFRMIQPQIPDAFGREGLLEFARPLFALIGDLHATVDSWAVRDDVALIEITLSGMLGGEPVSFQAVDRITLRDGVAIERRSYLDPAPLIATVLRRPRSWPAFARSQAIQLGQRLRGGRR